MKDAVNNNVTEEMTEEKLSQILQVRRDKLAALKEAGKDPFEIVKYDITANSEEIFANFESMEGKEVSIAGRMMSRRVMGKASFAHIADSTGKIQAYVKRDDVGTDDYKSAVVSDLTAFSDIVLKVLEKL